MATPDQPDPGSRQGGAGLRGWGGVGLAGWPGIVGREGPYAHEPERAVPAVPTVAALPSHQRFLDSGITSPNTVLLPGGPGLPGRTVSPQEQLPRVGLWGETLEPPCALEKGVLSVQHACSENAMKAAWKRAWACLWQVGNAYGVEVVLSPRPQLGSQSQDPHFPSRCGGWLLP